MGNKKIVGKSMVGKEEVFSFSKKDIEACFESGKEDFLEKRRIEFSKSYIYAERLLKVSCNRCGLGEGFEMYKIKHTLPEILKMVN